MSFTEKSLLRAAICTVLLGPPYLNAQIIGTCSPPVSVAFLDANNVEARITNTGSLFYPGWPEAYTIPRFSGKNSMFFATLWIGAEVQGDLRVAAGLYGRSEYWAGPLDDEGNSPTDCSSFDRIYKVTKSDVREYESSGRLTPDLKAWPTGLGAPTIDAGGDVVDHLSIPFEIRRNRKISLKAGERPLILGDQTLWWIMNDRGDQHERSKVDPLGVEVHGTAFGATTAIDAINNTTFYRYRIINRNEHPLENAYVGMFLDPDLGNNLDDYLGSDSLLALGFVYNSDNDDEREIGYGTPPPAVGIQFVITPLAEGDGVDNDWDGIIDEPGEQHGLSYFNDRRQPPTAPNEDPRPDAGPDFYNYLRGIRRPGKPYTLGNRGLDPDSPPVRYIYSGDPTTGEFWSEVNTDGIGASSYPGDRRMLMSSGPFTLQPGEETELLFSIVWAKGEDHLDSITKLKEAVETARVAYENKFQNLPAGARPSRTVSLISPATGVLNQPTDPTFHWRALPEAQAYELEITAPDTIYRVITVDGSALVSNITNDQYIGWRVRELNSYGGGPWSESRWFSAGDVSITNAGPFDQFLTVQNASGPLDPPDRASYTIDSNGFPELPCPEYPTRNCRYPTGRYQQSNNSETWGIHAGESDGRFGPIQDSSSFLARVTRNGENLTTIGNSDYEIRFTRAGGKAIRLFDDGATINVPFELWDIGEKTPDDPSDDVRLIPALCEEACGAGLVSNRFDIGGDHAVNTPSIYTTDPASDWIFWYKPSDPSPGEAGYLDYFSGRSSLGKEIFANMVLVQPWAELQPPYDVKLPEIGTVFRIVTGNRSAPILSNPADYGEAISGETSFYWSGPANDDFRLQVSVWPDFMTTALDTTGVSSGYKFPITEAGTYFWRVQSTLNGMSETWRFRLSEAGHQRKEEIPFVPTILYDNYPNPVRGRTTIEYFLPAATHVQLQVHDVLGRRVAMLIDREVGPGRHVVPYEVRDLANGIYFYSLQSSGSSVVKKMVVLR